LSVPVPLARVPPVLVKATLFTALVIAPLTSSVPVLLKVPVPTLTLMLSPLLRKRKVPLLLKMELLFNTS
jgi:hypothetical protein